MSSANFIRIIAYHGEPCSNGAVYLRRSVLCDTPASMLPDRDAPETIDNLDRLIASFEKQHGCKVDLKVDDDPVQGAAAHVFDVFEPSWSSRTQAIQVIDDLTARLVEWTGSTL
jgi:hypothetical protein